MGTFQASLKHWSVPRHVTLWQKMLVIFPVTFPLTLLTTSEDYSGSLEAAMSENRPTSSSVKWEVLLSLCAILSWMQHWQQPGGVESTRTLTTLKSDEKCMLRVSVLSGKSLCFLVYRFAELFDEAFSFGDFVCMVSSTLVRKWVKQIQSFAPSNCTFAALQAFSRA